MIKKETKKQIFRLTISIIVVCLFFVACVSLLEIFGLAELSREELQGFIESTGVVAPLIYIAISFLQVTFVPLPNAVTILAGNYVFGPVLAFIYSYIGTLLGTMLAYGLGKWIGRKFAIWVAGSKEQLKKWIEKLKGREYVLLLVMFFFPFFPDDILCVIAGLFPSISWLGFLVMQLVTRATSISSTLVFMSGDVIPFDEPWGIVVISIVAILCIVGVVLCFKYTDKINDFLHRHGLIKRDAPPVCIDTVEIQAIKEEKKQEKELRRQEKLAKKGKDNAEETQEE